MDCQLSTGFISPFQVFVIAGSGTGKNSENWENEILDFNYEYTTSSKPGMDSGFKTEKQGLHAIAAMGNYRKSPNPEPGNEIEMENVIPVFPRPTIEDYHAKKNRISNQVSIDGQVQMGDRNSLPELHLDSAHWGPMDMESSDRSNLIQNVMLDKLEPQNFRHKIGKVNKSIENGIILQRNNVAIPNESGNNLQRKAKRVLVPEVKTLTQGRTLIRHFHSPHFGMIDHGHIPRHSPVKPLHSLEGTFLWAVGLFGTVENGAIVLTAIFSRRFKRPLHLLVATLASTDLFISVIYIPSYTYFLLEGGTTFVDANSKELNVKPEDSINSKYSFCNVARIIFVQIASVTLTIKALIALYLYVLTKSKELAQKLFTTRSTLFFIIIAWGINFLMLFLPGLLGDGKVEFYPSALACISAKVVLQEGNQTEKQLAFIYPFTALAVHFMELLLICVCFMKIHDAIRKAKYISMLHNHGDKISSSTYSQAKKITTLVFGSFLFCWLPIYVINIIDPEQKRIPDDIHHIVMDLLLLKSAINPTIYIYGMRSVRYEMRLLCMCRCRDNGKSGLKNKQIKSSDYLEEIESDSTHRTVDV